MLEVGCGRGSALIELAKRAECPGGEFIGLDADGQAVEQACRRQASRELGVHFRTQDITSLPFADEYFDLVYGMAVLHHVDNWPQVPREVHRVLKNGASYYVVENTRPFFYLPFARALDHARSIFSEDELAKVIENAGFQLKLCERRGFYRHIIPGSVRILAVKR